MRRQRSDRAVSHQMLRLARGAHRSPEKAPALKRRNPRRVPVLLADLAAIGVGGEIPAAVTT